MLLQLLLQLLAVGERRLRNYLIKTMRPVGGHTSPTLTLAAVDCVKERREVKSAPFCCLSSLSLAEVYSLSKGASFFFCLQFSPHASLRSWLETSV